MREYRNLMRVLNILLLVLFAAVLPVEASEEDEAARVLRVGYMPGTGFLEEDWPGHLSGSGYEYMEFLSQYGGWKFDYVPCATWKECGEKLQSGEIDILPGMPGSDKSLPFAARTDHVVARFPMELVIQEGLDKEKLRIGTLSYNYPIPSFPQVAREEGFRYELVDFGKYQDLRSAFRAGSIDAYIGPMLDPGKADHVLSIFDRVSYRLLVRSDREQLLAQLNRAMDHLLLNQPNIRNRLNKKYMLSKGFPLILEPSEREYLREKGKLTTAVVFQQRPYAYREEGEWKGAIPEVIRQMEADLGVEIEILEISSIRELHDRAIHGKLDFVPDLPCDFSWQAKFGLAPTQPYMDLSYVAVMRRGTESMQEMRVACLQDAFWTKSFAERNYPEERRIYFSTMEECFQAVSNGQADVVYAPRGIVVSLMESTGCYNLAAGSENSFVEAIGFGVRQHVEPALWLILNKEINHLPPDLIRNAIGEAVRHQVRQLSPKWLIYHYPMQALMALMLLIVVIAGSLYYRSYMRRRHVEAIQQMAYTDQRYMLPNMLWLEQELPNLFSRAGRAAPGKKFYCVVFAMESKSSVAEMYGRDLLDRQFRDMSANLENKTWVLKTAAGIDAGHLVAICVAIDDEEIIELAVGAVQQFGYVATSDARISLHLRAGICSLHEGDFLQQIVERADIACQEGDGTTGAVRFFDTSLQEKLALQQKIEGYMEKALAADEFQAWYQPKYDIETRRIIGAEALVRWQSAELGFLSPGKFIPIFEKNGFVIPVDFVLVEKTFALQKRRLEEGKEVVPISVNQSRLHITEEGYLEKMQAIVDKYQIPKGLVELEITETVFGDFDQKEHREHAANIMHSLHEMGFPLLVDDFGSGFSSFSMLDYLPMDVMKIDRSLLVASDDSDRMKDILGNIIRLGKTLHMSVICEGIETEEQERLLLKLGCRYGQGFLNAKPMPEKEFVEFMEKRNAEVDAKR